MNYRFSRPSRCAILAFFLSVTGALPAQNISVALPDSLPHPDSLSTEAMAGLTRQLADQAKVLEQAFGSRAAGADHERQLREDSLKLAKLDSTVSKEAIGALEKELKTVQALKKTADKQFRQASQTADFTEKVANMDSTNQRKNIRKAWKQVKELDALLYPPAEKPVADMLNAQGAGGAPADSSAIIAEKRKPKEKKAEKPAPKYKPYDPAADVMLHPPQRPCALAVNTRDEFSGETYRETQREELFRFTNEVMKKILPPDQPHIAGEAALSASGANASLHLTFTIRDANARKAFGSLTKNSAATLKFLDGDTFTLNNTRNDDGARDDSGQFFTYRAQYPLDAVLLKKLRKTELDKIRIAWSTGYEDYDVQGVDVLMREGKCLFE